MAYDRIWNLFIRQYIGVFANKAYTEMGGGGEEGVVRDGDGYL